MKAYFETAKITGLAVSVGEREIFMKDEPEYYGGDLGQFNKLQKMIGFHRRFWAEPETTAADLCLHAARKLLRAMKVENESVEAVISVTQTPDYHMPGNAHILHRALGLPTASIALDVELGCSGYVYGLWLAYMMVQGGLNRVLLVAGDTFSRAVNRRDRSEAPLFGDAGCATLIERAGEKSPAHFILYSDGGGLEQMYQPAGAYRRPASEETKKETEYPDGSVRSPQDVYMDGFGIFNFTMTEQPPLLEEILSCSGRSIDEVDYFVLHQANTYIVDTIIRNAGIPAAKAPNQTFRDFGNQISASIAGAVCHELAGKLNGRRKLVLQGFGIGLSWGACLVETDSPLVLSPEVYQREE